MYLNRIFSGSNKVAVARGKLRIILANRRDFGGITDPALPGAIAQFGQADSIAVRVSLNFTETISNAAPQCGQ
jgi:hypothetical protein